MQPSFAKNFVFGLIGASFAAAPVLAQTASQMTPSQAEQSSGSNTSGSGTPSSLNTRGGVGGTGSISSGTITAVPPANTRAAVQSTPSVGEQSSGSNNAQSATPSSGNPRSNAQGIRTPAPSSSSTNMMPSGAPSGQSAVQATPSQSEQSAGSANANAATPSSRNPRANAKGSVGSYTGMHNTGAGYANGGSMKGHRKLESSGASSATTGNPDHSADQLNAAQLSGNRM